MSFCIGLFPNDNVKFNPRNYQLDYLYVINNLFDNSFQGAYIYINFIFFIFFFIFLVYMSVNIRKIKAKVLYKKR